MRTVWLGRAPYVPVWALQRKLRERVLDGWPDTLLLVEHEPVITLGRRATEADLLVSPNVLAQQGLSVVRIERGGQATYHGPGQLVVYPVCRLRGGVTRHVQWLTSAAVAVAAQFGLVAEYRSVGVFVGEAKLAAVGLQVEHQVAIHGLSLNVTPEATAPFRKRLFAACGARHPQVTSLAESGTSPSLTVWQAALQFAKQLHALRAEAEPVVERGSVSAFWSPAIPS